MTEIDLVAAEYRKAFEAVQSLLARLDMGNVPSYVFAIDRFDVKALAAIDPELAKVEQRRRQWRAALHSMAELTALQGAAADRSELLANLDPDAPELAAGGDMAQLDRFISVVQYARTVGCMYVDGGFRPVFKGSER